jgi:hypothetical protein
MWVASYIHSGKPSKITAAEYNSKEHANTLTHMPCYFFNQTQSPVSSLPKLSYMKFKHFHTELEQTLDMYGKAPVFLYVFLKTAV